jgi:hypothetical protein
LFSDCPLTADADERRAKIDLKETVQDEKYMLDTVLRREIPVDSRQK